jgi:hypothetical protein
LGDQVLAPALLEFFCPKEEINFEHFNVKGDSKNGVKRVINNTTTVKNN